MQVDLDSWEGLAEADQQPRHVELAGRQGRTDRDAAADEAAQLVDLLPHAVDAGEDAARAGGDGLACLGHDDRAAGALEQLGAELRFEPADLMRERRLGDVQILGGAGEVPVAGNGLDVPELAQLHGDSS